jgi:hypothetical protein
MDDLLKIPKFLQRDYDPLEWLESYTPHKDEPWWMPDLQAYKEEAFSRDKRRKEIQKEKEGIHNRKMRKKRIEYDVLDCVSKQNITYKQIRAVVNANTADNEIKSAMRRLIKQGSLIKLSRKTYKVKL